MNFRSEVELKSHVMPALKLRSREINKYYKIKISADEIWDNLKRIKWVGAKDLTLNEIVNDILKYSI